MVETDPQKIVAYTQDECRAKAAAKLVEAQTYLNDSDAESTQLALAAAQLWATLALSAPETRGPRCRYCGADCSEDRSWDGGDLYACPSCANDRAKAQSVSYDVGQALARAAELANAAGKKRTAAWLRACRMAYERGQEWPDAPKCRTLVSESDLESDVEQLPVDMLVRLRDRVQTTLTERGSTDARAAGERWRAGTGGGIPDYPRNVRPPGGGGAAQWREG